MYHLKREKKETMYMQGVILNEVYVRDKRSAEVGGGGGEMAA